MANEPPFYQEVLDALGGGNDPDLTALRDLCIAVVESEVSERRAVASPLITKLTQRRSRDPPFDKLSAALFYELMRRILLAGWDSELAQLMNWHIPAKVPAGAGAA